MNKTAPKGHNTEVRRKLAMAGESAEKKATKPVETKDLRRKLDDHARKALEDARAGKLKDFPIDVEND